MTIRTSNTFAALGKLRIRVQFGESLARLALAVIFSLFTVNAYAQEGKTILVLDASGSMWGQIDDGYKIRIAQDVINDLLTTLPAEQELGLMTYGHRRKGDCGDIELMVPPGANTRGAISDAIESLNPTGRTPLSASVIQAADELRIEENAATVILVSDGRETCDLDPCAVGSELEERGIDFTTHVIGFDIGDKKDRDQLRCLAENTGGKFLTASTASELTEALATVSKPIVTIDASVIDDEDTPVREGLTWTLISTATDTAADDASIVPAEQQTSDRLQFDLDPGQYQLSVTREEDGANTSLDIDVQANQSNRFVLTLPSIQLSATLTAPETVIIGEKFIVEWEGPGLAADSIRLAVPGSPPLQSLSGRNVADANRGELQAPSEPGEYEIRYIQHNKRKILATAILIVEEVAATISTADTGPLATSILIDWTGPGNELDYIAVAKPGETDEIMLTRTRDGNPLSLLMPPETGEYELRYVLHKDKKILTTRPITVIEANVSIQSPATAGLGTRISVEWTGPNEQYDYIGVVAVGSDEVINQSSTRDGSPLNIEMPSATGEYEIRYISNEFKAVLASQPITVTDIEVSLNAPEEAGIDEIISVEWSGPDETNDRISIGEIGDESQFYDLAGTSYGNPAEVQMPSKPGEYELRYILDQGDTILATRRIIVKDVEVTLTAPDEAGVGQTINVEWVGPSTHNNIVAIFEIGGDKRYDLSYTNDGSPIELQMPPEPGDYEVRFVLDQDNSVLATRPITATASTITLEAPDEAQAGELVSVTWEGPDENADTIAVAEIGDSRAIKFAYTRDGNPLDIQMPAKPGEYELRYVLHQGNTTMASRPITVTETTASLDAPAEASAGTSIEISWQGPNASADKIVIAKVGEKKPINSTNTRKGNPLTVLMPTQAGEYELRYVLYQGTTTLATRPITITEANVSLEAPNTAGAGESIEVSWVGPDANRDEIAIAKVGGKKINRTQTKRGNPLSLQMPAEPGEYEIRYVLFQDKTIMATRPITVTEAEVRLFAPYEVSVGDSISVNWVGPNAKKDAIAIVKVGEQKPVKSIPTSRGTPLEFKTPTEPGEYEIRYILRQGRTVLATRTLIVNE